MILQAENLSFAYTPGHPVLRQVSFQPLPGAVTAIFGPNGCGKSTLLRCLNAALTPQTGRVLLDQSPLHNLPRRQIARSIAVVPQETPVDVPFSIAEIVLLGRYPHTPGWEPTPQDRQIASDSLLRLQIDHLAHRPFSQVSGGERQRALLARALAQQTPILLLDEPAAHLDITHQIELYHLMRQLAREGRTLLAVCHDLILAPLFVDVAILLTQGRMLAHGPPSEVLNFDNLRQAFGVPLHIDWQKTNTVSIALQPT